MYAYVMRPETLPQSYWNFIVKSGPISKPVIKAVRDQNRGIAIDWKKLNEICIENGGQAVLKNAFPTQIPPEVLHPHTKSPFLNFLKTFTGTFRKTVGLHLTVYLLPMLVFRYGKFMRNPMKSLGTAVVGAMRSTFFLSSLCSVYMGTISIHRALIGPNGN